MRPDPPVAAPRLLTPGEVAARFRVGPAAVARWQRLGLLDCIRTPGGTRRYSEDQVRSLLQGTREGMPPQTTEGGQ